MIEVGAFTYEESTGTVTGPAEFMRSDEYAACVADIEAGRHVVFNYGASGASPNVGTALLVAIQTEYAAWKGVRSLGVMS